MHSLGLLGSKTSYYFCVLVAGHLYLILLYPLLGFLSKFSSSGVIATSMLSLRLATSVAPVTWFT